MNIVKEILLFVILGVKIPQRQLYIDFKSLGKKRQFLSILCMFSYREGVFYVPITITVVFCKWVLIVLQSSVYENIL